MPAVDRLHGLHAAVDRSGPARACAEVAATAKGLCAGSTCYVLGPEVSSRVAFGRGAQPPVSQAAASAPTLTSSPPTGFFAAWRSNPSVIEGPRSMASHGINRSWSPVGGVCSRARYLAQVQHCMHLCVCESIHHVRAVPLTSTVRYRTQTQPLHIGTIYPLCLEEQPSRH